MKTDRGSQPEPTPLEDWDGEEIISNTVATVPPMKTVGTQTEQIISDDKLDQCITSMHKMLATVNDDRAKASSISNVPDQLKKSGAEAYMPKVVSIGPLHRGGNRKELLYMEEIKWRCMLSLFHRTEDPEYSHKNCSKRMFKLDGVVRATYANDIKFDAYDLAKIMLLDGCFLLELLISIAQKAEKKSPGLHVLSDLKLIDHEKTEGTLVENKKIIEAKKESPGVEIGKMPLVLSDLKLLENQVPILILIMLFRWLFGHRLATEENTVEAVREIVNESALTLFGCNSNSIPANTVEAVREIVNESALILFGCNSNSIPAKSRPAHFLELLHCSMTGEVDAIDQATGEEGAIDQENNDHRSIPVEDATDQENNDHRSITLEVAIDKENNDHRSQLQRCATRLEAAGVKFERLKAQSKSIKPADGSRKSSRVVKYCEILGTLVRTRNILFSLSLSSHPVTNCIKDKKNKKPVVRKKKIIFGCNIKSEETLKKEIKSEGTLEKEIKSEGKLKIQPLYITETTEVLWRNLIAWEQNRIFHEKFLKKENRTRCKFSQYALLFNDLVCCEHDIQLLIDRGVLSVEDEDRRSNEDLMKLFRNVAKELQIDASGDVRFVQLIDNLNAYSGAIARGNCRIFWHHCRRNVTKIRYKCRNSFWILKHDHAPTLWKAIGVIAAIALLLLTIAQTIFGAMQL